MKRLVFAIFAALLAVGALGRQVDEELEPFTKVVDCIPLSVKIRPTADDDTSPYSISIVGEDALFDALEYIVEDGVLTLTVAGELEIQEAVQITVALPKDSLAAVENLDWETLMVGPGFEVDELAVKADEGKTFLDGNVISDLTVHAKETAKVVVEGTVLRAALSAEGRTSVTARGVEISADAKVASWSKIYILGSEEKTITGSVSGMGSVFVDTSASCDLSTESYHEASCKDVNEGDVPSISFSWTDSLKFSGTGTCSIRPIKGSRAFASSHVHGGGKAYAASSSSASTSSRGGSMYVSSSTSSTSGGTTTKRQIIVT